MTESRLQRWSRKKTKAGKEAELAPASTVESELSPEEQELAVNEAMPELDVLEKYDLPDPDAIELGTDITGFMRKEIPELLRRKALRALWKSNPVLAVLDGLNDYDEDFTDAATAGTAVKTLYKVGQGLIDKTKKTDVPAETQVEALETVAPAVAPELGAETAKPEIAADSLPTIHHFEPPVIKAEANFIEAEAKMTEAEAEVKVTEADAEPAPRYRPRMRFEH
ncbi:MULTISPECIES: DUF3306 domain-containing protein [unclassified Marinobacter]|uniref:DUF3306 domain-containing protein n=1 Tax=unclassified Marinobacter TaxID=83889 RepID=UPI000BF96B07|nr:MULTISPECIES: DUF3306 domain-containing protein [unclassified Marinobacter]PFG11096.1 uncharacterized protein DUF3306 [Marinobacter sp. LV10MA510-1]PFG52988.1 uncharacterized protein DUF3306 [Marinobacter sp. LV10R520-4]